MDHKGPAVGLQEHACGLGTGGVVGGGAAAMGALHAAAGRLLHSLLTIVALLRRGRQTTVRRSVVLRGPQLSSALLSMTCMLASWLHSPLEGLALIQTAQKRSPFSQSHQTLHLSQLEANPKKAAVLRPASL